MGFFVTICYTNRNLYIYNNIIYSIPHYSVDLFKKMKLEQLEFENEDKFFDAMRKLLNKEDAFRTYNDKDGKPKRVKVISKGRMYLGNNVSVGAFKTESGKIYFSVDYLGVEDRIKISQHKNSI